MRQPLHGQELSAAQAAVHLAHFQHLDDMPVVQRLQRRRFASQSSPQLGRGTPAQRQQFERYRLLAVAVHRAVDGGHAARAYLFDHPVGAEAHPRRRTACVRLALLEDSRHERDPLTECAVESVHE